MIDSFKEFLADWWRTRDWELGRWGLFALLAGGGLMVLMIFAQLQSPWDRSGEYLAVARHARASGDLEAASIYYRKALVNRKDEEAALYESMVVENGVGERVRRDAILRFLVEEVEYPPAMLFEADLALREGRPEAAREALDRALSVISPKDQAAGSVQAAGLDGIRRGLMRASWKAGDLSEAVEYAEALITPRVSDALDLGILHLRSGDREKAVLEADRVIANLGAQPEVAHVGALAEAIRGDATAVANWLGRLGEAKAGRWAVQTRCFELLSLSGEGLPDMAMLEPAVIAGTSETAGLLLSLVLDGALTEDRLNEFLGNGRAPVVGHLLSGLRLANGAKKEGALVHFEIAHRLAPNVGVLLVRCGVEFARSGREVAAEILGHAIHQLLEDEEAALGRAHLLIALRRWDEAESLLRTKVSQSEAAAALLDQISRLKDRK